MYRRLIYLQFFSREHEQHLLILAFTYAILISLYLDSNVQQKFGKIRHRCINLQLTEHNFVFDIPIDSNTTF